MNPRVAILLSHPGPAGSPFREISQLPVDLTVYFFSKQDSLDKKVDLTASYMTGYNYKFVSINIVKEIITKKFDVLIIYGWNSPKLWLAYLGALLKKIPVLIVSESSDYLEKSKKGWLQGIKKYILSRLFTKAAGFLYIGEQNKKFYKSYGITDSKIFFYPYAVDNKTLSELKKPHFKLGTNILFVGRLVRKKRPLDLIKAFEKLNGENTLTLVGDGPERINLEKYVSSHNIKGVKLVGFKPHNEVLKYYAEADIFVLPSGEGETWGFVVNEAMNFGLPIITSDIVECSSDLVKNGVNGYTFPFGDVSALSNHLIDLVQNKEKRKNFGEKSKEIIKSYSYESDAVGIYQALKSLNNNIPILDIIMTDCSQIV